jgi:adenine phosphoribosyltransferase
MHPLARLIVDVPDFPQAGVLFRDITPLLRSHFSEAIDALDGLWTEREWAEADAVAGVESRGFILAAALAERRGKGFVPVRKKGKLPPPVVERRYALEYGEGVLEMQRGEGRLILVDDVLATGGTLTASAELATAAGFRVLHAGVLIDLRITRDYRCLGEAPRAVIRYGG